MEISTKDLKKILSHVVDDTIYDFKIADFTDEQILAEFTGLLKMFYKHINSRHYTSIMDEPKY